MALTILRKVTLGGAGNFNNTNLYYESDRQVVINQKGAQSAGLIDVIFQGGDITVFAAKDHNGNVLEYLALPCPPYYHENTPAAHPGNVLA